MKGTRYPPGVLPIGDISVHVGGPITYRGTFQNVHCVCRATKVYVKPGALPSVFIKVYLLVRVKTHTEDFYPPHRLQNASL